MSHSTAHEADAASHASTDQRLVYMANQIATAFAQMPHGEAVEATRGHIRKFWDPRMRAKIFAHLDQGGEGLSPVAREALSVLKAAAAA